MWRLGNAPGAAAEAVAAGKLVEARAILSECERFVFSRGSSFVMLHIRALDAVIAASLVQSDQRGRGDEAEEFMGTMEAWLAQERQMTLDSGSKASSRRMRKSSRSAGRDRKKHGAHGRGSLVAGRGYRLLRRDVSYSPWGGRVDAVAGTPSGHDGRSRAFTPGDNGAPFMQVVQRVETDLDDLSITPASVVSGGSYASGVSRRREDRDTTTPVHTDGTPRRSMAMSSRTATPSDVSFGEGTNGQGIHTPVQRALWGQEDESGVLVVQRRATSRVHAQQGASQPVSPRGALVKLVEIAQAAEILRLPKYGCMVFMSMAALIARTHLSGVPKEHASVCTTACEIMTRNAQRQSLSVPVLYPRDWRGSKKGAGSWMSDTVCDTFLCRAYVHRCARSYPSALAALDVAQTWLDGVSPWTSAGRNVAAATAASPMSASCGQQGRVDAMRRTIILARVDALLMLERPLVAAVHVLKLAEAHCAVSGTCGAIVFMTLRVLAAVLHDSPCVKGHVPTRDGRRPSCDECFALRCKLAMVHQWSRAATAATAASAAACGLYGAHAGLLGVVEGISHEPHVGVRRQLCDTPMPKLADAVAMLRGASSGTLDGPF